MPSEYCSNVYYDVSITVDVTGVPSYSRDSFNLRVYAKSVSSQNLKDIGRRDDTDSSVISDMDASDTKDESDSSDGKSIGAGIVITLVIVGAVIVGVYIIRKRRQTTHTVVSSQPTAPTMVNINPTPAYTPIYPQVQPVVQTQYHPAAPHYYPQNHHQAMPSAPPRWL